MSYKISYHLAVKKRKKISNASMITGVTSCGRYCHDGEWLGLETRRVLSKVN